MSDPYRIHWAPVALGDLEDLLDFIAARDGPSVAAALGSKLLDRIDGMARQPLRCRLVPELQDVGVRRYRELIVFPYRIVFRVSKQDVFLLGILDGRRDLGELLLRGALRD